MAQTAASTYACPSLPSARSALALVSGEPGSLIIVARDLLLRAALVGIGMAIVGERENLVRNSIAGAAGIEVFVLAWMAYEKYCADRQNAMLAAQQSAAPTQTAPGGQIITLPDVRLNPWQQSALPNQVPMLPPLPIALQRPRDFIITANRGGCGCRSAS